MRLCCTARWPAAAAHGIKRNNPREHRTKGHVILKSPTLETQSAHDRAPDDTVRVAHLRLATTLRGAPEIFRSIQGEGRTAGQVRAFIRLSGCNLHCVWCDTAYTWNWTGGPHRHVRDTPERPHKFDPRQEMTRLTVDDVAARALALDAPGFVITGGEPLVQADAVLELITRLRDARPEAYIEIETNGTIAPRPQLARLVDQFNVSPKLSHSRNAREEAIRADALAAFVAEPQAVFKFVAQDPSDVDEVAEIAEAHAIPADRILIMAEGTDAVPLTARAYTLAPFCLKRGYGFTDRLHIRLFGDGRGV